MPVVPLSKNQFLYETENGDTYKIQLSGPKHDVITCTCKGYQFRRACKHIEEIKEMLLKDDGRKVKIKKQPLVDFPYVKPYIDSIYKIAKGVLNG